VAVSSLQVCIAFVNKSVDHEAVLFRYDPHHSMAVFVSRKALARSDVTPEDKSFLNKVIH
jgi:hypothetical protein